MSDVLDQLRDMRICEGVAELRIEAADEIERLRKELKRWEDTHPLRRWIEDTP